MALGTSFELSAKAARVARPTLSPVLPPKPVFTCGAAQPEIIEATAMAETAEAKRSGLDMDFTPCVWPWRPWHQAPACARAADREHRSRAAEPSGRRLRRPGAASGGGRDRAGA